MEQDAEQYQILYEAVKEQRYSEPRVSVPKSDWNLIVLPRLTNELFRSYTRMNRSSFRKVLRLIQEDPVFSNNSLSAPQAPVQNQLLVALFRLGHEGNSGSYMETVSQLGVSAGQAYNCTKRVITALYRHLDEVVQWPGEEKRQMESMINDEREGFIGAVGKIDGTDIVLHCKPGGGYDAETFLNREMKYALNLCAVCNANKEITYLLIGWPSSLHDARVFASTSIHKRPQGKFSPGQYLLGDAAYTNTRYLVAPYKAPLSNLRSNRQFNLKMSRLQMDIEHTFGMLKGRWPSLRGLRLRLDNDAQYKYAVQWIGCCCVLHNLLLRFNDPWSEDEGWWNEEEREEHDDELAELHNQQLREGHQQREYVKGIVLGRRQTS